MIHTVSFVGTAKAVQPVRRIQITPVSFWVLFGLQAIVVVLALFAIMRVLPAAQPFAATPDYSRVREAVLQRLTGATVDPLIEVEPGVMAPASSIRGFALNGVTYYYSVSGQSNFDPLSRAQVPSDQVRVVLRDTSGANTLTIYTLAK